MKPRRRFACLSLSLLSMAAAPALAQRAFVSAKTGSDGNPCTLTSPCRSFGTAIGAVGAGGEVVALDSGGYGPVTITKAITIVSPPGIYAGITAPSGDAITILAGATDIVTLRGLTLKAPGQNGIVVGSVGRLIVERCSITGFAFDGISYQGVGTLVVNDTDIRTCFQGISIRNASGTVIAMIDHSHLDANSIGFLSINTGSLKATISNSTASDNDQVGVLLDIFANGRVDKAVLEFCVFANNGNGVFISATGAGAEMDVSNCTVTGNVFKGLVQANGVLATRGNNTVRLNGGSTSGTITGFSGL